MIDIFEDISFYLCQDYVGHNFRVQVDVVKNPSWQMWTDMSFEILRSFDDCKDYVESHMKYYRINPKEKFNFILYFKGYEYWRKNIITLIVRQ